MCGGSHNEMVTLQAVNLRAEPREAYRYHPLDRVPIFIDVLEFSAVLRALTRGDQGKPFFKKGKGPYQIWVWVKIQPPGNGPQVLVFGSIYQVPFHLPGPFSVRIFDQPFVVW